MFHDESWKPIYLASKDQRSRSRVKNSPAWVFALLWVLASSSCVLQTQTVHTGLTKLARKINIRVDLNDIILNDCYKYLWGLQLQCARCWIDFGNGAFVVIVGKRRFSVPVLGVHFCIQLVKRCNAHQALKSLCCCLRNQAL